jgi:hypothetical protein
MKTSQNGRIDPSPYKSLGNFGATGAGACGEAKHQYRLGLQEGSKIEWHGKEAKGIPTHE